MGDVMELTTWPRHQKVFYRISASGLSFEVKTRASAVIGLAEKPKNSCDVWVIINAQQTSIKMNTYNNPGTTVRTRNILNDEEYKLFWLSWSNACIRLGQGFETTPLISYIYDKDSKYVTFSSHEDDEVNPVHWKVEVPPTCILEKPRTKSLTNGELAWIRSNNRSPIPDEALIGGYENENLYIIRARHAGHMTLGKLVPSKAMGYISLGLTVYEKTEFEVLCGFDCAWVPTCKDNIPVDAVKVGDIKNTEELYIGRAVHLGHLILGTVIPSSSGCYIHYQGREVAKSEYEILVSPSRNPLCANSFYTKHLNNGTVWYDLQNLNDDDDESYIDEIISI